MIRIISFFVISIFVSDLNAQTIRWADENPNLLLKPYEVFVRNENKIQILSKHQNGEQCFVSTWDDSLRVLDFNNLRFNKEKPMRMLHAIEHPITNQTFFLLTHFENESKSHQFYLLEFDDKGKIVGDLNLIFSIQAEKKASFTLNMSYSPNKSNIALVIHKVENSNRTSLEDFHSYIALLDSNMKIKFKKKYTMPNLASKVEYVYHWLSDNGTMLYYYKLDKKGTSAFSSGPEFINKFLIVNNQGQTINELAIEEPEKFFTDFKVYPSENNFLIGGFYSNEDKRSSLQGISIFEIDLQEGKIVNSRSISFNSNFYQRVTGSQNASKNELKGISNTYKIVDFKISGEGNAIFVAEKFDRQIEYINQSPVGFYGFGMRDVDYTYVYSWGDILTFSVSLQSEILWTNLYRKKQVLESQNWISSYDFYNRNYLADILPVSIYTKLVGNELNVIFNDAKNNYENQMSEDSSSKFKVMALRDFRDSRTYLYNINLSNGDEVIEAFFEDAYKLGYVIFPKLSKRIDANQLIIYGKNAKSERIGLIQF
jgi:hypothetical protein